MVREGDITQSRAKSLVLRKLQLRQSCRWNVTVFAENVSDSITQVRCKVRLTLGSQEIDPDHVAVMSVKATNLKSYGFLVLCNSFNSNSRSVTSAGVNTLTLDSQCVPIRRSLPVKDTKTGSAIRRLASMWCSGFALRRQSCSYRP